MRIDATFVEDGRIYVPAGTGRVAFVDVCDLAELAAAIFTSPAAHERCALHIDGLRGDRLCEAASYLSETLGRSIRYEPASIWGYVRHLRTRGMPWAQAGVQTVLHSGLRLGQAERVMPRSN
ncbi:MAG: SDR family NAD(P)-dependent oxidoreductase, partial [Myxococcota bacterium]|nr:SDR family NAD(P)-dependent oxidoreductase [Myxococcota bacterium]